MSIIEDRVVRATFDNSGFDSKVKDSTRSIENFEAAIEGKNFSNSFNPLIAALGTAQEGFSKLELVAVGVMTNIATKAVEAGQQLLKSFTIDPITQGFSKYETQTDSIQTVMAATGKSMEEVEGYMEKLSWFADETSYSLTDMTSNIGKFTAAGVDLDKSVTAMIGISNLAAISGQRSAEAARVMYNASQALSLGYMSQMDWKSVENANMATMEFKQILVDTALEMGTLQKAAEDLEDTYVAVGIESQNLEKHYFNVSGMRNQLSDKWLTGDVFVQALENYGKFSEQVYDLYTEMNENLGEDKLTTEILDDIKTFADSTDDELKKLGYSSKRAIELFRTLSDQVGSLGNRAFLTAQETKTFTDMVGALQDATSTAWSKVYEAIFGNYVEAKEFWSELVEQLYDLAVVPVQGIVARLKEWKALGGRDDFLDGIKNSLQVVQNLVDHLTDAFRSIFPKKTGEQLKSATKKFKEFTEKLVDVTAFIEKVKEPVNEIVDKIENGSEIISDALEPISDTIEAVGDAIEEAFEDVDVETVARGIDKLMTGFKGILTVVKMAFDAIGGIFKMVSGDAISFSGTIFGKILDWVEKAGQWLVDLRQNLIDTSTYEFIFNMFEDMYDNVKRIFGEIRDFLGLVFNDIFGEKEADDVEDRFKGIHNVLGILYTAIDKIRTALVLFRPFEQLKNLYSQLDIEKISAGIATISEAAKNLMATLSGKAKEIIPKLIESINAALGKLWARIIAIDWQEYIQDKIAGITRVIESFKKAINKANFAGLFNSVLEFGLRLFDAGKTFAATFDFSDILVTGVDLLTNVFIQARKIIDKVSLSKLVSNTTNIITAAFKQFVSIFKSINFSSLIGNAIGLLTSFTGQIKSFLRRADLSGFANSIVSIVNGLASQVRGILDKTDFAGLLVSALNIITKGIKTAGTVLNNVDFSGIISKGFNIIAKVISKIDKVLTEVDMTKVFEKIVYFVDIILDLVDRLISSTDLTSVVENFGNALVKMGDFIKAAQQGFDVEGYEGIKKFYDFAKSAFDWIKGLILELKNENTIPAIFNGTKEAVEAFIPVVKDAFELVKAFWSGFTGKDIGAENATSSEENKFGWVKSLTEFLYTNLSKIKGFFDNLDLASFKDDAYDFGAKAKQTVIDIWTAVEEAYHKIVGFIDGLKAKLSTFISDIESGGVLTAAENLFTSLFGGSIDLNGDDPSSMVSKIRDYFEKLKTTLSDGINSIKNSGLGKLLESLFNNLFGGNKNEQSATAVESVKKKSWLERISEFIDKIGANIGLVFDSVAAFINSFAYSMKNLGFTEINGSGSITAYSSIVYAIAAIGQILGSVIHTVIEVAMGLLEFIKENPQQALNIIARAISFVMAMRFMWNLGSFFYMFKEIGDAAGSVSDAVDLFTGQGLVNSVPRVIRSIIQSLLMIAISLKLVSTIPKEALWRGVGALATLTAILAALYTGMWLLNGVFTRSLVGRAFDPNAHKQNTLATQILALSASLLIIVEAVKKVASLVTVYMGDDGEYHAAAGQLWASIGAISLLLLAMAGAMMMIGQVNLAGKDFKKGIAILAVVKLIGVTINSFADSMIELKNSNVSGEDAMEYAASLSLMIAAVGVIGGFISYAFDKFHIDAKSAATVAGLIAAFGVAIIGISYAITNLADHLNQNGGDYKTLWASLGMLTVGILALAGISTAMTLILSYAAGMGGIANMYASAVIIAAMAASMILVATAMKMVSDSITANGYGSNWAAMGMLIIPITIMGVIALAIGKFVNSIMGVISLAVATVAIIAFSACLVMIGGVIGLLATFAHSYGANNVMTAALSIAAVVGVMGLVMALVGGLTRKWTGVASIAVMALAFAGMSFAISHLITVIAGLTELYGQMSGFQLEILMDKITLLVGAMGVLLIAIGIIGVVAGALTAGTGGLAALGLIAFAAALVIAAAAFVVFATGVQKMVAAVMSFSTIANGLQVIKELALGLGILAIVGALLAIISPLLIIGGAALYVFGGACYVCVTAIDKFASAIEHFAKLSTASIMAFKSKAASAIIAVLELFKLLVIGLIQVGIEAAPKFGELVGAWLSVIAIAIMTKAAIVAEAFLVLIDEVLKAIDKHLPSIIKSLTSIVQTIKDAIKKKIEENPIYQFIANKIEKLKTVFSTFGEFVVAKFKYVGDVIKASFSGLMPTILYLLTKPLEDFVDKLPDKFEIIGQTVIEFGGLKDLVHGFRENLEDDVNEYTAALAAAEADVTAAQDKFVSAWQDLITNPKEVVTGLSDAEKLAIERAAIMNAALERELPGSSTITGSTKKDIENAKDTLDKESPGLFDSITALVGKYFDFGKQGGESTADGFLGGLKEKLGIGSGESIFSKLLGIGDDSALSGFDLSNMINFGEDGSITLPDMTSMYSQMGVTDSNAYANGFGDNFDYESLFTGLNLGTDQYMTEAGAAGADAFQNAAASGLDDEDWEATLAAYGAQNGDAYGEGFTNSVLDMADEAANSRDANFISNKIYGPETIEAATNLGTTLETNLANAVNNFKAALDAVITEIKEKIESDIGSIVITPVLDLSEYEAQLKKFNKDNSGFEVSDFGSNSRGIALAIADDKSSGSVASSNNTTVNNITFNQTNNSPYVNTVESYRLGKNFMASVGASL